MASIVMRRRCSVCSGCGADVAPNAPFCSSCRSSFDGQPVPPAPAAKYHCLSCGAYLPVGAGFCPKCGLRITHFYAPGEQLSPEDTNRQNIQRLLRQQQNLWWLLALGVGITLMGWFICR